MRSGMLLAVVVLGAGAAWSAEAQTAFDQCGELVSGVECVLFENSAGVRYILDDRAGFVVGDRLRVVGLLEPGCVSICQEGAGCVAVARISLCDESVTLCGRLVAGVECVLFEDARGARYALDNVGAFVVGDRVRVRGRFERDCVTTCQQNEGCIRQNTIRAASADDACPRPGEPSPVCALVSATALALACGAQRISSARSASSRFGRS